jgi:hypothetical protein
MLVHGYVLMFYIVHWCLEDATFVRLNWLISCTILMLTKGQSALL